MLNQGSLRKQIHGKLYNNATTEYMVAVLPCVGKLTNWKLHHRRGDGSITDCLRRTRNMLSGCYLHKGTIRHIDTPIEETATGHFPQQTLVLTRQRRSFLRQLLSAIRVPMANVWST